MKGRFLWLLVVVLAAFVFSFAYSTLGADRPSSNGSGKKGVRFAQGLQLRTGSIQKASSDVYTLYLINKSDWTVVGVRVGGSTSPVSPFGRTCSTSCQDCFENGGYRPLLATSCTAAPFQYYIVLRKGDQVAEAGPGACRPDCQYDGEAACLDLDGLSN